MFVRKSLHELNSIIPFCFGGDSNFYAGADGLNFSRRKIISLFIGKLFAVTFVYFHRHNQVTITKKTLRESFW